jgi:sugar lactone lactonase YvrE
MDTDIQRVGDFTLQWGESLRWDDRRDRLYFVDCATQTLHWLEGAEPPLMSLAMPSLPTGLVLTDENRVIAALDDGLHVVDPDAGTVELLAPYPPELGGRANDAAADLDGNLVTGTLNVAPGPGSYWWFSKPDGWRMLDDGIGNANGPVILEIDGVTTLVFADTLASTVYAYDYDGSAGKVGARRTFGRIDELNGMPDGACGDSGAGVWSCVLGPGKIARFTAAGLDEVIDVGVELPSDVTFGGSGLDRMFFVSIALSIGGVEVKSPYAGALMKIDGTGFTGRPEPRFRLDG